MTDSSNPEPRRRNAAATRDAILQAAREAFVRQGYDGAGVREIAAAAGVTAMMVNRYFGSKEGLFAAVAAQTMVDPIIATGDNLEAPDRARRIAEALVAITARDATVLDGFQIMLRSAGSAHAAELGRAQIEAHHQRTVTDALSGPDAPQRAALLLSLVAGVQVMRQMIGLEALRDADPQRLAELLTPVVRALMETDI